MMAAPVVTGICTVLAVLWTFWCAFRVRERLAA
jgi:Na+/melibiose symporter-like transporter